MAASRRQHRKRKTDTYTVPEGGKRLKIGRNQATDQNGKRRQKSFKTQKAAKDWVVQTEQLKKLGIYTPESETITVKKAGDLWPEKAEQDGLQGVLREEGIAAAVGSVFGAESRAC